MVEKVLAGRDFEQTLVAKTADNIQIEPLYTAASARSADPAARGGVRSSNAWEIRQLCHAATPAMANAELIEELAGGSNLIELKLDRTGLEGVPVAESGDLRRVLDQVDLESLTISFDAGGSFVHTASMAAELDLAGIALNADPLGATARGEMALEGAVQSAALLAATSSTCLVHFSLLRSNLSCSRCQ